MNTKYDNTTTAPALTAPNGDVFILYFEKTERTWGGDVKTKFIFSVWSTRAEAERAEALAWSDEMHRNWTKKTVATWIEHHPVQCFANGKVEHE